jgi:hypothetical protein
LIQISVIFSNPLCFIFLLNKLLIKDSPHKFQDHMGAKEQYFPSLIKGRAIKAGGAPPRATTRWQPKKNITISPFCCRSAFFGVSKELRRHQLRGKNTFCCPPRALSFSAPFDCAPLEGNALLTRLTRTWPEPFIPARRFPSCRTIKSCSLPFTQLWPTAVCEGNEPDLI